MKGSYFSQLFGQHEFGSDSEPTPAAALLKHKAEKGMGGYQFYWAVALHLYAHDLKKKNNIISLRRARELEQLSHGFLIKSAGAGYPRAIYFLGEQYLHNIAPTQEEKNEALYYIYILRSTKRPGTEELFDKVNLKPVADSDMAKYRQAVENYFDLTDDKALLKLAESSRSGRFKIEDDLEIRAIDVPVERWRSEAIYTFLVWERRNIGAAYIYATQLNNERSEDHEFVKINRGIALILYELAAERRHPEAAAWYGEYHACQGDKLKALFWLNKAKGLGFQDADYIIAEILELGKPSTCIGDWALAS